MCGIFGWQWRKNCRPTAEQRNIISVVLGSAMDSRGGDSWGWYNPDENVYCKDLGDVGPFVRHSARHDCLIGHTRKATVGQKTKENSHPFFIGNIIGAHNGVVYNHDELNKSVADYPVDSMHIFHSLDAGEDLAGVRGYGAMEWIDKRLGPSVRLVRASGNSDLAIVQTKFGCIWASLKSPLKAALVLAGIHGDPEEAKAYKVYVATNGVLEETSDRLQFSELKYTTAYGSTQGAWSNNEHGFHGSWPGQRPTPPEGNQIGFHLSKSERKTIGRAAGKALLKGIALICRQCYREVDDKDECPRGHREGVLVVKETGTESKTT